MKILIVEDDRYTAEAFKIALIEASYSVDIATEKLLNWELLELSDYDLILLDATLPKLDNLALCKRLRDNGSQIPILMTIDSHTNPNLRMGLEAGATDYIIKPFDLQDLIVRIESLLDKDFGLTRSLLKCDSLTLNIHERQLIYAGTQIHLDLRESSILELFFRYENRIFSSSFMCDRIFFLDRTVTKETIRNIIKNLISKTNSLGIDCSIEAVYGVGYYLKDNFQDRGNYYPNKISDTPCLLIVSPDLQFTEKILIEAGNWGLKTQTIATLANVITQISKNPNNIVILDGSAFDRTTDLRNFLGELYAIEPLVSVVIFLNEQDIKERLTIGDFGPQAVSSKSASSIQILETIVQNLKHYPVRECKILVIDSRLDILQQLRNLLEPWGFIILTLEDDLKFWEIVTVFSPEMLIIGEFKSQVDRFDFCRSVRETSECETLPIIFLISNSDNLIIHKIFDIGADDYVCQPIVEPQLVNRVLSCWEKVKLNRHFRETNLVTSLSNYDESTKDLEKLLNLAKRQNQNLSLVILHIHNFGEINQLFGYVGSNKVLHFLGKFLKESLRTEDVVAHRGEEFLVSMYGINKVDAIERLNQVLVSIHSHQFLSTSGAKFKIDCSIGIGQYPEDGTDINSLYHSTKQNTLYRGR
jgi:diguanylate cyclase (GGDEF)-like protein